MCYLIKQFTKNFCEMGDYKYRKQNALMGLMRGKYWTRFRVALAGTLNWTRVSKSKANHKEPLRRTFKK